MNRIIYISLLLSALAAGFSACRDDKPDSRSIFVDPTGEMSSFDRWLRENYVDPYNVRVAYRLEDIETDFDYNVIPADILKSKQLCVLMKYLWIDAYVEVADDGIHFIRSTIPKLLHLVGSAEYDPRDGTMRLGVAEGGMKITITDVNNLDPLHIVNQYYFGTIHHEFGHVLHQTKAYPVDFNTISAADYLPTTWFNRHDEEDYLTLGFITDYAGAQTQEDFVETLSRYVTFPDAEWNRRLQVAGPDGSAKILRKLEIVRKYLRDSWGIDIDQLHTVVQRRVSEIPGLDLDNLDF